MTQPDPPPQESDERARMTEWFNTVSYVEQYLDKLPEVDDPEGDN